MLVDELRSARSTLGRYGLEVILQAHEQLYLDVLDSRGT